MENKIQLKTYLKGFTIFFLLLAGAYFLIQFYQPILALSNSVNFNLGYIDKTLSVKKENLMRDYYVYFVYDPSKSDTRPYIDVAVGQYFIKRLACLPGDYLSYDSKTREFRCNGVFIGKAKERFLNGETAKAFEFNGKIPPGKYFVVGDHKDSFDSRYWGFVDITEIEGVIKPLF